MSAKMLPSRVVTLLASSPFLRRSVLSASSSRALATSSSAANFSLRGERGKEPLLFTPGPLTTSMAVKRAMLEDLGSRDPRFLKVVDYVRNGLLALANTSTQAGYECVIVQGSGSFGVEGTLGTAIPRVGGKLLVAANGAYGLRMASMAQVNSIPVTTVNFHEREPISVAKVMEAVKADPTITHIAVVHHETTAGVLNDIDGLGKALLAHNPNLTFIVDSMSAFGAYPVDVKASNIHYLVSSSNKCVEGVPGFSYAIARRDRLVAAKGNARSLVLDIHAQWQGLAATGQFRFTPPTHALLAFAKALEELEQEGGAPARLARYQSNFDVLTSEMKKLGFSPYVDPAAHGCIIVTFMVPDDPNFNFSKVYAAMEKSGFVLYPGKTTKAESFRMGCIGRMFPEDMRAAVEALKQELVKDGVKLPVTQKKE